MISLPISLGLGAYRPHASSPPAPATLATAAAALAAYHDVSDDLGGWTGFTNETFDTTVVCTTPDEVQAAITTWAADPSKLLDVTCDWDGPLDLTGGYFPGPPATALTADAGVFGGYQRPAGGVRIRNKSGKAPCFGNSIVPYGVTKMEFNGVDFAKQAGAGDQRNYYMVQVQRNVNYPIPPALVFKNCNFGLTKWRPADPRSKWCRAIAGWTDFCLSVHVEGCEFDGALELMGGTVLFWRLWNNHAHNCTMDFFGEFSFAAAKGWTTADYANIWFKDNVVHDWVSDALFSTAHTDFLQYGTASDGHAGYRILCHNNMVHTAQESPMGAGSQTFFGNPSLGNSDNTFVVYDNILSPSAYHAISLWQDGTNKAWIHNNTLALAGKQPQTGMYPWIQIGNTNTNFGEISLSGNIFTNLLNDATYPITETGSLYCDPRAGVVSGNGTTFAQRMRPEDVFKGTFARDGSDNMSFSLPGELGSDKASAYYAIADQFEPILGWGSAGCADPETWPNAPVRPSTPITSVAADGWQATYPSPPTFDPVGSPETVTVSRSGFNTSAAPVTVLDTLTIMSRVRKPYPDQYTKTTDQVALSEFVYADDVITGVTNNSIRPYPKPQALWLQPHRQVITGSTLTVKLVVAHAHARNGTPVAAVKFKLTDGTNTVEQIVSVMTSTTFSASGLTAPHYQADLDVTGLIDGAVLTLDAEIYPWVGTMFAASSVTTTNGSNFAVQQHVNDRGGAYGAAYAYVDGIGATPAVSANPVTAATTPYATIAAAAAAIKVFNNGTYGRNNTSGGVIRLTEATHVLSSFSASVTDVASLVIEAADPAKVATTIFTGPTGASVTGGLTKQVRFRNLTIQRAAATSKVMFDTYANAGDPNSIIFENCIFDINGNAKYDATFYKAGAVFTINCSGDDLGISTSFGGVNKNSIYIGCNYPDMSSTFSGHSIACRSAQWFEMGNAASVNQEAYQGRFIGWNSFSCNLAGRSMITQGETNDRGFAAIGNVLEAYGAFSNAAYWNCADGNLTPAQNVNTFCNTVAGERLNYLYNDNGGIAVAKSDTFKFNAIQELNIKSDTFYNPTEGYSAARIGNWSVTHRVNHYYNALHNLSATGNYYSPDGWQGEFAALGEISATPAAPLLDFDYVNDQSADGGNAGGGDYTPKPTSPLPIIPDNKTAYPVDLLGRVIPLSGAVIGAVQYA